jgi:dTDP-4-amino-4,6-dideoxygalactose transaminase
VEGTVASLICPGEDQLADELDRRARLGLRQPAAIEAVRLVGHPADLQPIMDSAEPHGVAVVEDASEALGATYASDRTPGFSRSRLESRSGGR